MAAPRPVQAGLGEADYQSAASQLNKYGLVQGDDRGYRFGAQITRAEMAKLLIYSLGQQSQATKYVGRGTFKDTDGHWAEGILALAKLNGIMKGYPDGTVQPDAALTYAEVITALARLAGLQGSDLPWPRTYLGPAQEAGIVPDGMELYSRLDQPAARGDVFVLLWRTLTVVKNQKGENLLRTYLDRSAPILTVDQQPNETTDLTLMVSGTVQGADRVIVNGAAATLSFGYFQATVNLRLGPNTIRIQALDDAGNVKEQVLQITRKQSPISAIALTGPAKVAAGDSATFVISLKDQNDQEAADRKGIQATVAPSDLGDFDINTGVFTAATKPGTGTITVKAGAGQSSVNVAVVPGVLDHLTIDPPVAAVEGKQTAVFAAKGADKYGNDVAVSNVQWSASAGTISQNGVYVAPDFTGQYTVTASAGGMTATAQVQPPNYKAKSVRLSQPATTLKANGAGQLTLTATVLDESGNVMTDYMGSLTVTSSQPGVAYPVPQTVLVNRGVAQVIVQAGRAPGTATITASTNLVVTGSASITVAPQRLQSVRLNGYAVPGSTAAYPVGYVEVTALDEDGYPMYQPLNQTMVVHLRLPTGTIGTGGVVGAGPGGLIAWFTQNDSAEANVALGSLDPTTDDVRSRTYINYTAGAGTMLIEGTVLSTMSWVRVQSGALSADQVGMPARVSIEPIADTTAGADQYVYVVVLDGAGYRISRAAPLVGYSVRLKDQDGLTYTGTTNNTDIGVGRFRFTVNQAAAGTYTYIASLQPGGASDSRQGQVVPASVATVKLTATPDTLRADNGSQATLRAELLDGFGNRVTGRTYQATFHLNLPGNGALQSFADRVVRTSTGVAELKVTASTVVAWDDVRVTVDNPDPLGADWVDTARITTQGGAERLVISYGDNDGDRTAGGAQDNTGRVGQTMAVYVDVVDRFGNPATFDSGRSVSLTVRNMATGQEGSLSPASISGGRATFAVSRTAAATYALKAQSNGLTPSVTAGFGGNISDLIVQPAQSTRLAVAPDLSLLRMGGSESYSVIRAQLVDAQGNPAQNQTGHTVTVKLEIPAEANGGTTRGTFRIGNAAGGTAVRMQSAEIADGAAISTPVYFFAGTTAGAQSVTWTALDGTGGNFTISTIGGATTPSLRVKADETVMAPWTNDNATVDGQSVTVTVQDSNGIQMSNAEGTITVEMLNPDTRVVAEVDPVTGNATSLDSDTTNLVGDYPTLYQVTVHRGQAVFRVRANTSGMKAYRILYPAPPGGARTLSTQAYGMFLAP